MFLRTTPSDSPDARLQPQAGLGAGSPAKAAAWQQGRPPQIKPEGFATPRSSSPCLSPSASQAAGKPLHLRPGAQAGESFSLHSSPLKVPVGEEAFPALPSSPCTVGAAEAAAAALAQARPKVQRPHSSPPCAEASCLETLEILVLESVTSFRRFQYRTRHLAANRCSSRRPHATEKHGQRRIHRTHWLTASRPQGNESNSVPPV